MPNSFLSLCSVASMISGPVYCSVFFLTSGAVRNQKTKTRARMERKTSSGNGKTVSSANCSENCQNPSLRRQFGQSIQFSVVHPSQLRRNYDEKKAVTSIVIPRGLCGKSKISGRASEFFSRARATGARAKAQGLISGQNELTGSRDPATLSGFSQRN